METNANTSAGKKYIRTFSGDMEIVKNGGTPDLMPLNESKSSPAERLVAASPVPPASSPVNEPIPDPQPIPQPIEIPSTREEPTPIKTYAGDFSDRMKDTQASTATVLAAEQDAAPSIPYQSKPRSAFGGFLLIFAGAILFFASGFGAYFVYSRFAVTIDPIISASLVSTPIFVDEREQVSGTGAVLLSAIRQSINRPLAPDTVRLIYSANATSTDNSIFSALQIPAPNILLRNINALGSMAGILKIGGDQSPFFILSVFSYNDTFSGMLSWEPLMPRDLAQLFPSYEEATSIISAATSTLATTTTAIASTTAPKIVSKSATTTTATSSAQTSSVGFHDEVVSNHDVRVYRDVEDRIVFLYGYWDQMTLIIARNPTAFVEIVRRLASSRVQQ